MLINLYNVEEELTNSLNILAYDKSGVLYHLMYIILPNLIKHTAGNMSGIMQLKNFDQLVKLLSHGSWYFTVNTNLVLRQKLLEKIVNATPYGINYSGMQPYEEVMFKGWSFLSSVDVPFWVNYNISYGNAPYHFILSHSGLNRDTEAKVYAIANSIIPPSLNLNEHLFDKELRKILHQAIKKEHQSS